MYIIVSIFVSYALGIITYELNIFGYYFTLCFALLIYNSLFYKKYIYNAVILVFVILAYINCNYNSNSVISQHINENITIMAKIKNQNKSGTSYNTSVIGINGSLLFNGENIILYPSKNGKLQENSIIKARCNVADNKMTKNKMLFNYDNYLRSKKIKGTLFVVSEPEIIKEQYSYINNISKNFREYTERTFYNNLNKKNADIILSIILGNVDYLDIELYDNIKLMGLAHIFAVSGTHIVLMYVFLLNVLKLIFSRRISWIVSWFIIWFYGLLIGFPVSVMRALVMFTLVFGSEVLYRKYNSFNSIGLAALVLTIYNPFWIFDAGFLLSFSAALSFIIYNRFIKIERKIFNNLYMYLFLQVFTLPVILYYFNFVSVMGVLYNLLLLPIFTIIILSGFILILFNSLIPVVLIIPFKFFDYILYSLRFIVEFADKIPFKGLILPSISLAGSIFFYIAFFVILYLYNKNNRYKKYSVAALLGFYCITYLIIPMRDNGLYFNIIDVGQGLFTTIQYKGINLIYDCGSTSNKNMGNYIAVPYLTKKGITNVDAVFISHWDEDHYSGLNDILSSHIKIKRIFSSRENDIYPCVQELSTGHEMKFDDLYMEVLWPYKDIVMHNVNNSSLVISINFNNKRILLTGDVEKEAEYAIYNNLVNYDIVIVPHHGSKSSSTVEFVDAISPVIAVLSYGKNNYGIPSKEVLLRYENEGSKIFTTFDEGEINFILKDGNLYYNTYMNEKSDNYYELYLEGFFYKLNMFLILIIWMKGENKYYELRFDKEYCK